MLPRFRAEITANSMWTHIWIGDDGLMLSGDPSWISKMDSCSEVHVDADEVNSVTGAASVAGELV